MLQQLVARRTDKEIADVLMISPKTVRSHIDHLGDKFGVHGRRAIVAGRQSPGSPSLTADPAFPFLLNIRTFQRFVPMCPAPSGVDLH